MTLQDYKDEIVFKLTGGVLDIELDDSALTKLLNASFREVKRYIDTTKIITIPYSRCIDLKDCGVSTVVRVYRANGYASENTSGMVDPMYASQWQLMSGVGNMHNFSDYVYNYAAWNTLLQIRNQTSTDLAFRYDKSASKLYINIATQLPSTITIEFIPTYNSVEEIVSDYWIDTIIRLSVALAKVTLGRIRSRYTQSNALWTQDGDRLLEEGTTELNDIREKLLASTQLCYPVD